METFLVIVACVLLLAVEFLVCAAIVAPRAVARFFARLGRLRLARREA
jgi:hypothetical protein